MTDLPWAPAPVSLGDVLCLLGPHGKNVASLGMGST